MKDNLLRRAILCFLFSLMNEKERQDVKGNDNISIILHKTVYSMLNIELQQMVIAAMKLKDAYSLEGKLWPT